VHYDFAEYLKLVPGLNQLKEWLDGTETILQYTVADSFERGAAKIPQAVV